MQISYRVSYRLPNSAVTWFNCIRHKRKLL